MTLTRKEREGLVIGLLNKCTPIREIASRAGLSFREIGAIKKKEMTEKEAKEGQAQEAFASTQSLQSLFTRYDASANSYCIEDKGK